jgi:membrane protease YdiL (CAAX protease family)
MIERRRVAIYLVVTFGFTWSLHAVVWATGGLEGAEIGPGLPVSLPIILVSMFGPAFGNLAARVVTREGWGDLRLGFRGPVRAWLVAWPGLAAAAFVGALAYFAVFPDAFDPSLPVLADQLAAVPGDVPLDLTTIAIAQIASALLLAPFINAVPAFGEEFGWRGYLQWKLRPLGWRPMVLWTGLIWGVWHWPLIALGYNYGTGYPGAPWTGMVVFLVFTTAVGAVLAWVTEATGSVFPASLGHGVVNAVAGVGVLAAATGTDTPLLGPTSVGLLGVVGFVALAWLVARRPPERAEPVASVDGP